MPSTKPATSFCALVLCALVAAAGLPAGNGDRSHTLAAFGTIVTLRYYGVAAELAGQATAELEAGFRQVEDAWYPWGNGELRRINEAIAAGEPVTVSAALASMLQRAAELEQRSGGLFNPAIGALTELWGFNDVLQSDWRPPPPARIAPFLNPTPSSSSLHWSGLLRLTSDDRRVVLDPGGIAKGAILADAARQLQALGIRDAIIDIGGDLLVTGRAGGHAARIGIRKPGRDQAIAWIAAEAGEAVVTSGNYERYFEFDGRRYMHVLDPRSGYPASESASVTVVHRDPLLADAAATALLVAGSEGFDALCERLGVDQALLITASGDLRLTNGLAGRVHWLENQ